MLFQGLSIENETILLAGRESFTVAACNYSELFSYQKFSFDPASMSGSNNYVINLIDTACLNFASHNTGPTEL